MACDAVENLDFFIPVRFDLNQIFRKWAFLIFWAADGRNNPVSLLSSETLVGVGKCEHFRLGSRGRVVMVAAVGVAVVGCCLQYNFGGQLPAAGVPGMDKETHLWIMKLHRPFNRNHTIWAHLEPGIIRKIGCPWLTSASFETHSAQDSAPLQVPPGHGERVCLRAKAGTARIRLLAEARRDLQQQEERGEASKRRAHGGRAGVWSGQPALGAGLASGRTSANSQVLGACGRH